MKNKIIIVGLVLVVFFFVVPERQHLQAKPTVEQTVSKTDDSNRKPDSAGAFVNDSVPRGISKDKESTPWLYVVIPLTVILIGGIALVASNRRKAAPMSHISCNDCPEKPIVLDTIIPDTAPTIDSNTGGKTELNNEEKTREKIEEKKEDNIDADVISSPEEPVPHSVVNDSLVAPFGDWIVVGASVKGNGHIQNNMPCQDNHRFEFIGDGWGVAIVSDGAGSAAHSHLGSRVVAERGVFHFKNLVEQEGWKKNNTLPTDVEWLVKSYNVLKTLRDEVGYVAQRNNVEIKTLSATCLAIIFSPIGLLAVHVGDGRMGYKTCSGEWKALMTPHKGEEANQTIFLVSDFWSIPNFMLSGVLVPESLVVREPVKAFALMSDGCENTAWNCTTLNPETGKYYDRNKPFEGFFNPLEETMASFYAEKIPEEERQEKWYKFIESGTKGFVKEQDDKTMIYGLRM